MPASRSRTPVLLCVYHALFCTLFPVAIFPLFWTDDIGMSVTTMMTVQAFFGLSIALFEFPSGYVADRLGHRLAVLLGSALVLGGWFVYTLAGDLWSVVAAELVLGVGYALISGADSALLYEALKEQRREVEFGRWYGRMRFIGQIAEGTSALCAGYLYAHWNRLPFAAEVGVWVLSLLVVLRLREAPRAHEESMPHLRRMGWIVRESLVVRRELRSVLLMTVLLSLCSFVPVWLIALYAKDAGMPTPWIGPFWAVANYVVALGSFCSERIGTRLGLKRAMLLCIALTWFGYVGLAASHALYGVLFYFALTFMRGLQMPLLHHEEQRLIPSGDRAGFVSFRSFLFRGSFVVLGPVVGRAVEAFGQRPVLLVTGTSLVALALLVWLRMPSATDATEHAGVGAP